MQGKIENKVIDEFLSLVVWLYTIIIIGNDFKTASLGEWIFKLAILSTLFIALHFHKAFKWQASISNIYTILLAPFVLYIYTFLINIVIIRQISYFNAFSVCAVMCLKQFIDGNKISRSHMRIIIICYIVLGYITAFVLSYFRIE